MAQDLNPVREFEWISNKQVLLENKSIWLFAGRVATLVEIVVTDTKFAIFCRNIIWKQKKITFFFVRC